MSGTQDISTSMEVTTNTTAGDIKAWLANVPEKARLSLEVSPYYNQFDRGYQKIRARWTQEVG